MMDGGVCSYHVSGFQLGRRVPIQ